MYITKRTIKEENKRHKLSSTLFDWFFVLADEEGNEITEITNDQKKELSGTLGFLSVVFTVAFSICSMVFFSWKLILNNSCNLFYNKL